MQVIVVFTNITEVPGKNGCFLYHRGIILSVNRHRSLPVCSLHFQIFDAQ